MSKVKQPSLTRKLGGNRALVLGVVLVLLVVFAVADMIPGFTGATGQGDFLRFTVDGREVTMGHLRYETRFQDWHRFHTGFFGSAAKEDFLADLMVAEMARDAGVAITDGTLREWIQSFPAFTDGRGRFDPEKFDLALELHLGGMSVRSFEQQARLHLLVDQFRKMYGSSFLTVTDAEAWERWKREHPKVSIAYAWQPTAPIRKELTPESVDAAEVERFWSNPRVQERYRLPKRYAFRAAFLNVEAVGDRAYLEARKEWKDDPGLRLDGDEAFRYWNDRRKYDFNLENLPPERVDALRKENEEYDAWVEENGPFATRPAEEEAPPAEAIPVEEDDEPKEGEVTEAPEPPPAQLPPRAQYDRFWRFRIEKELWLRRLLERIRETAKAELDADGTVPRPLEGAAEKWSRPGLVPGYVDQVEPVDQYGVERIPGLGGPVRFAMNTYRAADKGKFHDEVLPQSNIADDLSVRGWATFRVMDVVEPQVPPLEDVREKVVAEILDEKAREEARARLEKVRKQVEDTRRPLEEVAKEAGYETAVAGPFNEYSWRPPLPLPKPGEEATPAEEGWKDPDRRKSAIMGKYFFFREVPVGAMASIVDDTAGSGAFYLVQVRERAEPGFEEMTEAQVAAAKRQIRQERSLRIGRELSYAALKDRFALTLGGQTPEEQE